MFFVIAFSFLVSCQSGEEREHQLSIWLPEWQMEAVMNDVEKIADRLQNLRVFGVYFNEKDKPFIPDTTLKLSEKLHDDVRVGQEIILTFINDYVVEGEPTVQKDDKLLHRLLRDQQSRQEHIADILTIAEQQSVDGVEIDYERINEEDYTNYGLFLQELYDVLQKKGVSLYVVLEPSFEFAAMLPVGPRYTIMAYNVHGYHSGPGAKATFDFLDQLVAKVEQLDQDVDFAFATGGFVWSELGEVTAITEVEAEALLNEKNVPVTRDPKSDAISFTYVEDGTGYEAWYADATTLQNWVQYIQSKNAKYDHFVLWRAGGMAAATLEWIREY